MVAPGILAGGDFAFHETEHTRLLGVLQESAATSQLPEAPSAGPALHDLLVRIRLAGVHRIATG